MGYSIYFRTRLIRIHYLVFKDQMPAMIEMAVKKPISIRKIGLLNIPTCLLLSTFFRLPIQIRSTFFQGQQDIRKSTIIIMIFYPCQEEKYNFLIDYRADEFLSGRLYATHIRDVETITTISFCQLNFTQFLIFS